MSDQNLPPITAQYLERVLRDPKLSANIVRLGDQSNRNEWSFRVFKNYEDPEDFYVTFPEEGERDNAFSNGTAAPEETREAYADSDFSVLDFHSHPHPAGSFPSILTYRGGDDGTIARIQAGIVRDEGDSKSGDLYSLANERRHAVSGLEYVPFYFRPIGGIVSCVDDEEIDLVLIQEKTPSPLLDDNLLDLLDKRPQTHYISPPQVVRFLERTGFYNSMEITFDKTGKVISPLDDLAKFEYTPRLVRP